VAELYRSVGLRARENLKKLGGKRIARSDGSDLGDLDVLVVDPTKRVLLAVEVKDFEVARTPVELANEMSKLLEGSSSAVERHRRRVDFVRANLADALVELGIDDDPGKWQVVGQVTTSASHISPHLLRNPSRVAGLDLTDFETLLQTAPDQLIRRRVVDTNTSRKKRKRRDRRA